MDEPTKEAIEEASALAEKHYWSVSVKSGEIFDAFVDQLATMLAAVRKKARDDALEEARDIVDCVRFTTTAPEYEGETVEQAAQEMMRQIVELKDQPSGEA